jgi:HD-like signal output (HDOD) protein
MDFIEKLRNGISNLPTLPTVYTSISEVMKDPNARIEKIAQVISADQASAFKILKVANSPFYGYRGKIDTVSQAIMFLGYGEIKNIIFALTVMSYFSKDKSVHKFRPVDFWAHSIAVGLTTRFIGSAIGERVLENYFLSGVLHDVGKLIFFELAAKEYEEVINLVNHKNMLIRDAETEILGIDHSKAGSILSEKWKLPSSVHNAIQNHHAGIVPGENKKLVASVHVADIVARALELGYPGDNFVPKPVPEVWQLLSLPPAYFHSISEKLHQEFENFIRMMLVE